MLKVLGGEQEGEFKAVASGTLPNGKPVIVNADGTVSVVEETSATQSTGTAVEFDDGTIQHIDGCFDSNAGKVVVVYRESASPRAGCAVVGTISGSTISFGTPVNFDESTSGVDWIGCDFDSTNNRVVIAYRNTTTSNGEAIVGTVSGTSISFGTAVVFAATSTPYVDCTFDSNAGKVLISYRGASNYGYSIVGTVSGTSISFGTAVAWQSSAVVYIRSTFDSTNNKVLITFEDSATHDGYVIAGSISGTSVSFGNRIRYLTGTQTYSDITFDPDSGSFVIVYDNGTLSAIAGYADSSDNLTLGTALTLSSSTVDRVRSVYNAAAKKHVVVWNDGTTPYALKLIEVSVSGTTLAKHGINTLVSTNLAYPAIVYDSTNKASLVLYQDFGNGDDGQGLVYTSAYTVSNLTAENYIGMSSGSILVVDTSVGSSNLFNAASTNNINSVYDENAEKTVFFYTDEGNSSYGTAIVADSTGSTLSYGSEAVFETANASAISCTYDSSNNKVVVAYRDNSNSNRGTACVGTVSGTSISFGTPVIFTTNETSSTSATFDSSNNKVVIHYRDNNNSAYPTAIVGTVSGNSISFGTPVVVESAPSQYQGATFDSTNNKVILSYNAYTLNKSKAAVGTVSGTSISFGTAVEFWAAGSEYPVVTFDSTNSKVVFAFGRAGTYTGTCVVGTVSGTTMTFGTAVVFDDSQTDAPMDITFDSYADKIVIAYKDKGNSNKGTYAIGTVSGTDITFEDPIVFSSGNQSWPRVSFDSSTNKVVTAYRDTANSDQGTGVILQVGYENRYPVADGSNVRLDIIGSISKNQNGLTAGEKYYVQSDGTLGTTAGSPSVLAGTATSSTELLVKT